MVFTDSWLINDGLEQLGGTYFVINLIFKFTEVLLLMTVPLPRAIHLLLVQLLLPKVISYCFNNFTFTATTFTPSHFYRVVVEYERFYRGFIKVWGKGERGALITPSPPAFESLALENYFSFEF